MPLLCLIAGVLCLGYFVMLLLYSGFTSTFYLIWPLMSAAFFILGFSFKFRFWQMVPAVIRMGSLILFCIGLIFFLYVESMILKASVQMPADPQDYVIILGAHVRSSGPSKALALRLDKALEYSEDHPDTIFIVSGGQGSNEPCTESSVMKQYLIRHGMDAVRIIEEDQSTNTRENLLFSQKWIPEGSSVGIISNDFHICRALHLAETLGYEDASGIPAKSDLPTQPANLLREFFAVVKDFWIIR
ncbi:MAG: YdcF family protein [Lachnospiraceae bacterium]|nr:YdcF family protein [Lachnospiraceae bacterium]